MTVKNKDQNNCNGEYTYGWNWLHVDLHAYIEWGYELYHSLLHVTNFWHSIKYICVRVVKIYVRNKQFDVHLTLLIKFGKININHEENINKYYYIS